MLLQLSSMVIARGCIVQRYKDRGIDLLKIQSTPSIRKILHVAFSQGHSLPSLGLSPFLGERSTLGWSQNLILSLLSGITPGCAQMAGIEPDRSHAKQVPYILSLWPNHLVPSPQFLTITNSFQFYYLVISRISCKCHTCFIVFWNWLF